MKTFYLLVLLTGFCMAVLMQLVTIATPRDAFVASVLSKSPADWELTLNDELKSQLVPYNVKAELVTTMQKRASFQAEIYLQNLWVGCGLIIFSSVGLIRERKISRMHKAIEQATAPNAGTTLTSGS